MERAVHRLRRARRLGPALVIAALLGLGAIGSAGELAILHRALTEDAPSGQAGPLGPCQAPAGAQCLPGFGGQTAPPAPTTTRVGLEMTACYLGCPVFTAIFSADGTFSYVGEMNVERMGDQRGRVDLAGLHQVMRLADEVGFAQLDDTYASPFLDNPTSYLMVEWPQQTKVVRADGGVEPAGFWAIRELLLGLLEGAEWGE